MTDEAYKLVNEAIARKRAKEDEPWSLTGVMDSPEMAMEELNKLETIFKRIADALGTAEIGEGLVEVARNAHRAEQALANLINQFNDNADVSLETALRKIGAIE